MKKEKQLTHESFILDLIAKRQFDLKKLELEKQDYSKKDYQCLWNRWTGSLSDLYLCITAHNNPLSQISNEDKGFTITKKKKIL